jgi:filamentous hemagglutinin
LLTLPTSHRAQINGQIKGADGQMHEADAASAAGGVSVSIGGSKSQSNTTSTSDSARGSSLNAAGNISLRATGAGQDSDLTLQGTTVQAGGTVALKADDAINLLAASNTTSDSNSNNSTSGSIGVGFGVGNGSAGFGVTVSASVARGHGNGQSTTYSNTRIDAANVTIDSGGDTTLKGAVVAANSIRADIGGNLRIESLQDSASYTEKQTSAGASVTVGAGGGGSANFSQSRINSVYASVAEQSGLKAGDGGFQVNVRGNTTLVGGAITSTQAAIDNNANSFSTAQLTSSDIDNKASYSASSISVSGGSGGGSAGFSNESASASSTTRAAISGVAGNTAARTGDKDSGLANTFDREAVRSEMQANTAITQEFGKQAPKAVAEFAISQRDDLTRQAREATAAGNEALATQLNEQAAKWDEGGIYRVAMHTGIGALSGGLEGAIGAGGIAAGANTIDTLQRDMQASVASSLQAAGVDGKLAKDIGEGAARFVVNVAGAAITAGSGSTAAGMALNVDANNRQLHPSEMRRIHELAEGDPKAEARLVIAGCALVKCSAEFAPGSAEHTYWQAIENKGATAEFGAERALLNQQQGTVGTRDQVTYPMFQYGAANALLDGGKRIDNTYNVSTRVAGGAQAVLGAVCLAGSVATSSARVGGIADKNPVVPNVTVISAETEEKILFGQRVINEDGKATNRIIGAHSGEISNARESYAVETLSVNADGTRNVKLITQFEDGNVSRIKNSTLFPETWSNAQTMDAVRDVSATTPVAARADGAKLYQSTVNGVKVEVIKIGDEVVAAYPCGKGCTPASTFSGKP